MTGQGQKQHRRQGYIKAKTGLTRARSELIRSVSGPDQSYIRTKTRLYQGQNKTISGPNQRQSGLYQVQFRAISVYHCQIRTISGLYQGSRCQFQPDTSPLECREDTFNVHDLNISTIITNTTTTIIIIIIITYSDQSFGLYKYLNNCNRGWGDR